MGTTFRMKWPPAYACEGCHDQDDWCSHIDAPLRI